jgi:hypothetical protein
LQKDTVPPHRSAVSRARAHLSWKAFEDIFYKSVGLFYNSDSINKSRNWKGLRIFAIDGSKHILPANNELRKCFNAKSGLGNPGKGHYPQCLVSTVFDVLTRIPVSLSIDPVTSNERKIAIELLSQIPENGILTLDRGYPGYELLYEIKANYKGHCLIRCQSKYSFKVVSDFLKSGRKEAIVKIDPSEHFRKRLPASQRKDFPIITVRLIRYKAKDGTLSALLTDLIDTKKYSAQEIIDLYRKRWGIETYYRNSKTILEIERFHSRTKNGILQEFFALATMMVLTQVFTNASKALKSTPKCNVRPQDKHAIKMLGQKIGVLVCEDPLNTYILLLELISRVKFYQSINQRKTQPRVSKTAPNKWTTKARYAKWA